MLVFAMSLAMLIIPTYLNSHISKSSLYNLNLAEMVFLSTGYIFLVFNMVSVEDNFQVGYAPIVIFGSFITAMLLSVIVGIIRQACKSLRKW